MGQGKSQFSEEELQDYEVKIFQVNASIIIYIYFLGLNIFFKERSFIVSIFVIGNAFLLLMNLQMYFSAHQKFKALAPEKVGHNKNAKLPMNKMLQYPELAVNPFGERICKIFSSSRDGDCTFEDFLDMMSVFSEAAPKSVKAEHAFRIFGELY